MSIVAIIPARMASSRFPGKPLATILGLSMIEHVRRRVTLCEILDDVIVATCDKEILNEVEGFDGKVMMTSDTHETCIDRVGEIAMKIQADIIINIQGDMPLVDPNSLKELVKPLLQNKKINYADLMTPIIDNKEINDLNVVKVVSSLSGNALYYTREAIPSVFKKNNHREIYFKQLGINAFRKKSLIKFLSLKRSPLEKTESIDMLRLLENDLRVKMVRANLASVGVDTKEDLEIATKLMKQDATFFKYK